MYNADDHDLVTSRCTVVRIRLLVQWYIFSMSKSTLLYLFLYNLISLWITFWKVSPDRLNSEIRDINVVGTIHGNSVIGTIDFLDSIYDFIWSHCYKNKSTLLDDCDYGKDDWCH